MLRVLIADDHAITREGLKRILTDYPEPVNVGNAADAAQTLSMVRRNEWDLVLLDISLPDKSGLDVLKSIKKERPSLPVLVLSMYPVDQYALRVLRPTACFTSTLSARGLRISKIFIFFNSL